MGSVCNLLAPVFEFCSLGYFIAKRDDNYENVLNCMFNTNILSEFIRIFS